jgi:plasmid maintenance system antidote protein VapI
MLANDRLIRNPIDMKARRQSRPEPRAFIRRFMLLQAGISISSLAKRLNISNAFASNLIAGKKRSQEKEAEICRMLRVRKEVMWS